MKRIQDLSDVKYSVKTRRLLRLGHAGGERGSYNDQGGKKVSACTTFSRSGCHQIGLILEIVKIRRNKRSDNVRDRG